MEATNREHGFEDHTREYAVKWALVLEFSGQKEQEFCGSYLPGWINQATNERPWVGVNGTRMFLTISDPIDGRTPHPDYGPDTKILFEHQGLRLTHKQLWAYETWAQSVASDIRGQASHALQVVGLNANVFWDVQMTCATPLRNSKRSYRIASQPGDIVRMPAGDLAVVTDWDVLHGGHVKQLTLRPICGIFRHLVLLLCGTLYPAEGQIDKLTKIGEVSLR